MLLSTAIRERINSLLGEHNMSAWKLYKATGVPKSTINSILSGDSNDPKQSTILHICEGFGITLRQFYDDDIFNDIEDD